jgi:hypothetical protein
LLARQLASTSGFFLQQEAELFALGTGGMVTTVIFVAATLFSVRQIRTWQQCNAVGQARSTMWVLGSTPLVIVPPLFLAIILPEQPAP